MAAAHRPRIRPRAAAADRKRVWGGGQREDVRYTARPRFPIRALLHVLIAFVLAVTLAVVGYVVMLSLRQEPVAAGTPSPMSRLPSLPEPDRLPRRASFAPASAGGQHTFPAEMRPLAILVRDLPAARRETAGVAVYDEIGAHVAWLPLRDATESDGALRVETSAPTNCELRVVVADAYATARNGYWCKLELPANLPLDAVPELRAGVQDVLVHTSSTERTVAGALRLRRLGDATWIPRTAFVSRSDRDQPGVLTLRLGPGSYEVLPWTEGTSAPVAITVPGPSSIDATFAK